MLDAVVRERDRLLAVVNSISDEIWFADPNGDFSLINHAGLREFDLNARESVDVAELAAELDVFRSDGSPRPVDETPPLRALKGEVIRDEEEIIRTPKTGDLRYRQVSSSPVCDAGGAIIGSVSVVRDITARKRAEAALRQSEGKYRKLHESMRDAFVIVDMDGRILEYNPAYQEMLGYSDDELRRLTYVDITPGKWHSFEARLVAERILPLGFSGLYQKEYRRKDGSFFPVELSAFLIRDDDGNPFSIWAIVRDITVQKQAELTMREWNQTLERRVAERTMDLQQSEARFRQLAETTFEGIAITENGILYDCNTQLATIHGYELAEMIGRPILDFIAPESHELVVNRMRQGNEVTYECFGLRKDGSRFPTEIHARMGKWHGKISRITALRDLTDLKLAADKLHAQQTELEHAQRLALISEVSAGIIHQIGQPLCAMGANVAVVMAKHTACTVKRCGTQRILRDIEADVDTMRKVITHMRTLAHDSQSSRVPTDLNRLLEDVLHLLRQEAANRQIRLVVRLEHDLPPVAADGVQINQVILNLVRNAFDACADSPPDRRTVSITIQGAAGPGVEMSVTDAGSGIAPTVMERLFEPFFTTKSTGLGIGLRLSRTIITAHGGSIHAHNNPNGIGATFRVILPRGPKPAEAAE